MTSQQEEFAARVARIRSGETGSRSTVFVGPDEVYQLSADEGQRRHKAPGMLANAGYPLSILAAFLLGLIGHALAVLVLFHIDGLRQPGANPDIELVKQGVVAFSLTMVLGYLLHLRSSDLTVAKSLGVVAGILLFHNAVHLWPAAFEALFSPMWVGQIIAETDPRSVQFRGLSLRF